MSTTNETENKECNAQICILHGEDEVAIQREVQRHLNERPKDSLAELNLTRLDGQQTNLAELANNLNTLPFGEGGRMVVVSHALELAKSEAAREELLKMLENLPESSIVIFIIPDELKYFKGKKGWVNLEKAGWLTEWAAKHGEQAKIKTYSLPTIYTMPKWVQEEAELQGGKIEQGAAIELANALGNDTMLVSQEISKLITYTGGQRAISSEDVRLLCSPVAREDIFALTDAIASGDARTAMRLLDISLQNQPEVSVFAMIVRHFRQLLTAAEMVSEGSNAEQVRSELRTFDFVAEKLVRQARRFTLEQLEQIFQRLDRLDEEMKDGRTPADLALQLFVAEMARVR